MPRNAVQRFLFTECLIDEFENVVEPPASDPVA